MALDILAQIETIATSVGEVTCVGCARQHWPACKELRAFGLCQKQVAIKIAVVNLLDSLVRRGASGSEAHEFVHLVCMALGGDGTRLLLGATKELEVRYDDENDPSYR